MKAGACYVPLDPAYPAERLAYMCRDAGLDIVLRASQHDVDVPGRQLILDSLDLAAEPATRPDVEVGPQSLAYVMYTSGSTGRPKGVAVTHRNIVRLVRSADSIDVRSTDTAVQAANISFDAATLETWGALLNGARLVGLDKDDVLVAARLRDALVSHGVDVLFLPTSLLRQVAAEDPTVFRTVRNLSFGGEQADVRTVASVALHCPDTELINLYGPTEITTYATAHRCQGVTSADRTVPIGWPAANSGAYLLDDELRPVPSGTPGELFLGGAGVARGYLGRPGLTAQRFLPDPFAAEPGARMYRAGDLARRRADGALEFLGRVDRQVKVRGHRVEPAETEEALRGLPGIVEVAVVADRDAHGDTRLVAYVVLDGVEAADVRAELAGCLPAYLVPAVFVVLPRLPLNANGKVDLAALPAPLAEAGADAEQADVTPAERAMLGIWQEALGIAVTGVDANFFELGGNSLAAARVRSRLSAACGVDVPLQLVFDHPTVTALAAAVEGLTTLSVGVASAAPVAVAAGRDDLHPLTAAQRRMWLHDRLWPGSPMYQVHFRFELAGPLDVPTLVTAFDQVLARHQALRTVFVEIDGEPWQRVLPHAPASTRLQVGAARYGGVFDLAAAPPVRAALVPDGADRWVLHLELHHIVCDGWSMGLFFDDLSRCYVGAQPDAAPRHVDVAVESDAEELVTFWRDHLDGAPPTLDLPVDRPRPLMLDESGAELSFTWPAALADGVAALATRIAGTPFMVLLAAWQAVLSRYGGPDFVVATPVSGRTTLAAEGAVGLFTNTVALRAAVPGSITFRRLLNRVRDTTLGALAHQELPFDTLVDRLRVTRDPGRTSLAQVMFAMESGWAERLRLPGIAVHGAELPTGTAMFDLTLTLTLTPDGIAGRLEYRTSLFTKATAARLAGHVRTLLSAALADPDRRVADLPLLDDEERRAIDAWTATRPPSPDERPVTELIAGIPPERVAVVCGDQRVSYGELGRRADHIAATVRDACRADEAPVGVCLRPGPDAVAAFLGVLAAGAMYVPLDPDLPAERVRFLIEDSGTALVLADSTTAPLLPEGPAVLLLGEPATGPRPRPAVTIRPDQAAYLIYTSGSTGRPKGVVSTHRGLTNLAAAIGDLLAIGPDDRVLQFHAPGFNAVVSDMLTALCAGAELHLARRHERMPGPDLAHTLREHRITMLDVPPVVLQAMDPADAPDLRVLTVGGEACPADVAAAWQAGRSFYNTYGPTETSVMVTGGRYAGGPTVPIGRPLTGARIHVLDDELRPVPIGVTGGLYVGGACVGRGYLGRSALTAAAFVPDPFAGGGARLYRTGDLARWRSDGTLDILGRRDGQVKIRGNRVEPAEAEARLRECAGVARCAVVVREDRPGDKRLVGYVVPDRPAAHRPASLSADALRDALLRRLPDYLVPAAFIEVPDLPTTPNGKLDYRALPAPAAERPRLGTAYRAPRGSTEQAIAEMWRIVLGLDRIGADDNFFDLGGNSMLLVKVHTGLRESLGVRIVAVDLFRYPTVARLARFLDDTEPDPARVRTTAADGRRALAGRSRRMRAGQEER